jgi:hypothetical protein
MEALKFIFSSFWIWLGFTFTFITFVYATYRFLFLVFNRAQRHRTLRKIGYPPEYCDADGDLNDDLSDDDD